MTEQKDTIQEEEIGLIITYLTRQSPFFNKLIPSFTTRHADSLNACLSQAKAQKDPLSEISLLFYLINKKRPFPSGNRRIAMVILLYLLAKNNQWIKTSQDKMFHFAHWVSTAPEDAEEAVVRYIEKFISAHTVAYTNE